MEKIVFIISFFVVIYSNLTKYDQRVGEFLNYQLETSKVKVYVSHLRNVMTYFTTL